VPLLPTLPSWKLEQLRKNRDDIVRQLDDLNRDFRAEVILLTAGDELVAKAGTMQDDRAVELAMLVARGAEAAAQAAAFLGERAERFEQSLHEGSEYRLYSYSLGQGIVLSLALSTNVPLGMLKLQTKRTSQDLIKKYIR
jgi:predicted regulator of Ras-like GTPase activity (Roadblock/LC7/MglB family)